MGELKLLAECYDQSSQTFTGKMLLYNLSADASEERDLSALLPSEVHRLGSRLLTYAKEAAEIPPLGDKPPWQGDGYYCAKCKVGKPVGKGKQASWEPWCEGASGVAFWERFLRKEPCPLTLPTPSHVTRPAHL